MYTKRSTSVSGSRLAAGCVVLLMTTIAPAGVGRAASPEAALAPGGAAVEASPERAAWKKRWIASWVVLAAVNVLDVHSSTGHGEANPLLRDSQGRFAPGQAILIKSAIAGGFFSYQLWRVRAHPEKNSYAPFTILNGIGAGALGGVAAHNYSLPRPAAVPAHLAPQP
jgi:hypothetical protein